MIRSKNLTLLMATLAVLFLGVGTAFANLIPNGDFSAGNTGFTSAYTYHALTSDDPDHAYGSPLGLYEEKYYGVGINPLLYHVSWASFGDHTGQGNMMIVNGATDVGSNVWASPATPNSLAVTTGETYYFAAWFASIYPQVGQVPIAPAKLAFSINGVQVGADFTLSAAVGTWELFYQPWVATSDGYANISLINRNSIASGNDFALDDISFGTSTPVPEPISMLLFSLGLLGLAGVRRKLRK